MGTFAAGRRLTILAGLAVWSVALLPAQFAPLPQADSPEEFDAYLRVLAASTPTAVIDAGNAFVRVWPSSGLRGHVYELEFEAYRALGDAEKAIATAEKSLEAAPDNLLVLANLAVVLANAATGPKRLAHAEECANKAIARSKSFRVPKFMSPREWEEIDGHLNSQAHAALGLVANKRGDTPAAIREFETAITLAPAPDATQYYRLGVLYGVAGNKSDAIKKLRQAAELNEPSIRRLAERELKVLESH